MGKGKKKNTLIIHISRSFHNNITCLWTSLTGNDFEAYLTTDNLFGRMQIQDVYKINKDVVEFLVYVYPQEIQIQEILVYYNL